MKHIGSTDHGSILRDTNEAIKQFHWETVRLELVEHVPTLMSLLTQLVGRPSQRFPLLCLIASMMLKSRNQHISLVQRAISIMLYGNGTAKQVSIGILCTMVLFTNILTPGVRKPAATPDLHVLQSHTQYIRENKSRQRCCSEGLG